MTTIVRAHDLCKSYGTGRAGVVAVQDASFQVNAGEIVAIVGPSGSGKTTLLNMLAGWEQPDVGTLEWLVPTRGWADIAVVPQQPGLLEELPAAENAVLPVRLGSHATVDVLDLLQALGISDLADRLPSELSHGEQQRVSIARALVTRPRLLVADEPTAHLDDAAAGRVLALLRSSAEHGTACLIATHDERVRVRADRILSIKDGRLSE